MADRALPKLPLGQDESNPGLANRTLHDLDPYVFLGFQAQAGFMEFARVQH